MISPSAKWGIVATVKAPAHDLLTWAAYHLEAGAHRLFIYLDAPCPAAQPLLAQHPKIRVFDCDDQSWKQRRKNGGKPDKHQVRQTLNATRAYRRQAQGLDWLIHIDVDEFHWSQQPLSAVLARLPASVLCARVYPIESLSGDGTAFKGHIPTGPQRGAVAGRLYPTFGEHVMGGFLSHTQGKLFVRPGLERANFRIHNIHLPDGENPAQVILSKVDLCHFHARDWDSWMLHYRYRLHDGSYRADLKPARPRDKGGVTMHELLSAIETDHGTAGLRAFFDEMCADTPALRARLEAEGYLRIRDLQLDQKRRKHFPEFP